MMTPEQLAEEKAKYIALLEGPKWRLLWEQWGTICTTCDHEDCADGRLFYAEVERMAAENAELRKDLAQYEWRPIAEIGEDFGPCVLINLTDGDGYMELGSVMDSDFKVSYWTHFAEAPKLTIGVAERLIAAMQSAAGVKP